MLEHYDAMGQWRDADGSTPVDARADWNGEAFDGPAAFKSLISENPHEFTRGFIEHLLSYALGRELGIQDMPTVKQIQERCEADDWRFGRVIVEIANAYPFTHVRVDQR